MRLISLQSAGMLDSSLYQTKRSGKQNWVDPKDQDHLCISALDLEGKVVWRQGEPWELERPWRTHGGGKQACFHDIDGDGHTEMVYLYKDRLRVLDAETGEQKEEVVLDADNFAIVVPVNVEGHLHRRAFLLKVQDMAYDPYAYANPTVVYGSDLKVLWIPQSYVGAGHHPFPIDSDGDGKEEVLIGYTLVDHDGTVVWALDIPDPLEHCDNRDVADWNEDGVLEIAHAGSRDAIVCTIDGKVSARVGGTHVQGVRFAKLDSTLPGLQLICAEKWGGFTAYDLDGQALWTQKDGGVSPVRWREDDEEDLLIYRHPDRAPILVDGTLEPKIGFERSEWLVNATKLPKGDPYAAADYGKSLGFSRIDVDGDGVVETLFHNRYKLWVFGGPGTEIER